MPGSIAEVMLNYAGEYCATGDAWCWCSANVGIM